jgi:hypothetical protein
MPRHASSLSRDVARGTFDVADEARGKLRVEVLPLHVFLVSVREATAISAGLD